MDSYGEYHRRIQNLYATGGIGPSLGNRLENSRGATLMDIVRKGNQLTDFGKRHTERIVSKGNSKILGARIVGTGDNAVQPPAGVGSRGRSASGSAAVASGSGQGQQYSLLLRMSPPTDTQQQGDSTPSSVIAQTPDDDYEIEGQESHREVRSESSSVQIDDSEAEIDIETDDEEAASEVEEGEVQDNETKQQEKEEKVIRNKEKRELRNTLDQTLVVAGVSKDLSHTNIETLKAVKEVITIINEQYPLTSMETKGSYYRKAIFTVLSRETDHPRFLKLQLLKETAKDLLSQARRQQEHTALDLTRTARVLVPETPSPPH